MVERWLGLTCFAVPLCDLHSGYRVGVSWGVVPDGRGQTDRHSRHWRMFSPRSGLCLISAVSSLFCLTGLGILESQPWPVDPGLSEEQGCWKAPLSPAKTSSGQFWAEQMSHQSGTDCTVRSLFR